MQGLNELDELLVQLQSVDNETRTCAERNYESLPASKSFQLLLQYINDSSFNKENKIFAAVLARRLVTNKYEDTFGSQNDEMKSLVKKQLIELIIVRSEDAVLRKKISEIASQLALECIDGETGNNNWPEYLQFMIECSQSNDAVMKEISCQIFETIPHIFGNEESKHLGHINQWLSSALQDPTSIKVREAAVAAMTSFLTIIQDEPKSLSALSSLAPVYLMCIEKNFTDNPESDTMISSLVEVAESVPKFIKPYLLQTLQLCFNVLINENILENIRHLALEAIITLSESMPVAVRKQANNLINPLVSHLLMMMTDFEDDPDWEKDDDPVDEDDESNAIVAELSLDRFACALSNKQVLQVITEKVPAMLSSGNWKHRVAGLMAISSCAEGCMKEMEKLMSGILEAILPKLTDSHPRVRYAACNTIGQMCVDFGPKIQKLHHSTVIPALMSILDDPSPRVQAIGGAAIVYFCEKTPKNVINTYLAPMIEKLHQVMATKFDELVKLKKKHVLQQIVTTVASIADSVQEHFTPYYEKFMPVLKFIMQQAHDKELRMLRGKTIECISLIGLAVGKEKFAPDVEPIMELLLTTHLPSMSKDETNKNEFMQKPTQTLDPDDPQISFMIGAWARICKLMGAEFQKYLPIVIPQVLETASIKPDVCLVDNEQAQNVDEEIDWHVVKLNQNQNFAIRTSGLEDKSTACRLLLCFAKELKEAFAPYCEKVLEIMLPTLRFYFNDEVREAAAEIMPYILDSIKLTSINQVQLIGEVWNKICSALLEAISNEPDRVLISSQLEALSGCVEILGPLASANNNLPGLVTQHQLTEFHNLLDRMFHEHFEKDEERSMKRTGDDYDEIEEDRLQDESEDDEYVLSKIYELVHAIFVTHKSQAIPFFQLIMNHCLKLLEPARPYTDLQWGVCFWADLVEFCPEHSWSMKDYFMPAIARSINHTVPEVRQNILLTIGMIAMHGPVEFTPILSSFVLNMIEQIEMPNSRDEGNNNCTENCISALTKMMKYRPECLSEQACGCNSDQFLTKWLSWLPVWEDDVETEHVYNQLCELVESNNPIILGENNCNLPHIVSSISYAITMEGLTEETGIVDTFGHPIPTKTGEKSVWTRCVSILMQVYSDQTTFQSCINQLDEAQKKSIASALKIIN